MYMHMYMYECTYVLMLARQLGEAGLRKKGEAREDVEEVARGGRR